MLCAPDVMRVSNKIPGDAVLPMCFLCSHPCRSLRVLRVSMKIPGVRVVVNALRHLIPSLFNTLSVGLLFYYIFAVRAVLCNLILLYLLHLCSACCATFFC
jgi:hypothetical protein